MQIVQPVVHVARVTPAPVSSVVPQPAPPQDAEFVTNTRRQSDASFKETATTYKPEYYQESRTEFLVPAVPSAPPSYSYDSFDSDTTMMTDDGSSPNEVMPLSVKLKLALEEREKNQQRESEA